MIPTSKKVSGDKNAIYRPIVITSPFLQTMEELLLFSIQKSIRCYQFTIKCKIITLDDAIVLQHDRVFRLEKGKQCVQCALIDYTSAFYSTPRPLLHNEFARVNTDNWLCSYLSEREQYAMLSGNCSTSLLTYEGVAHKSVLVLFLHDLTSTEISFAKYADDLNVYTPITASLHFPEMNDLLSLTEQYSVINDFKHSSSTFQIVNFSLRHE